MNDCWKPFLAILVCLNALYTYYISLDLSPPSGQRILKQPAISQARHHKWCVLVMVGANLFEQRRRQRDYCRPTFYHPNKNLTIQHIFVAGIPSYDERPVDQKVQGQLATAKEINVSLALLEEQRLHGDMYVTPHRDYYRDLAEKRLGLLKYGVENGCDYIFKTDHEYCLNVDLAQSLVELHESQHSTEELYIGNYLWKGTEFPDLQESPHREHTPYMSGWVSGVSNGLASVIVGEDWMHSVLKGAYGSSSEDVNLGHWVKYASTEHDIKVHMVHDSKLLHEIPSLGA